jgi:hypothetical protein
MKSEVVISLDNFQELAISTQRRGAPGVLPHAHAILPIQPNH